MKRSLSLRVRLTLLYTGLLFTALVLVAAFATWLLHHRLTEQVNLGLAHRIQGVENFLRRETRIETADKIPEELAEFASTQPEGHLIEVRDDQGRVLLRSERAVDPATGRDGSFSLYGRKYQVRAAASLAAADSATNELGRLLLALSPALLLVTGGIGYWVSGRVLTTVDEMTQAARAVSFSDLSARLPEPSTRDELGRLAEAWNEMLGRLEESVTRIRRFTTDAAHELRTPLTAIRTTAELAIRRERTAAEYRRSIEQMLVISERMTGLVESLMVLARGDGMPVVDLTEQLDVALALRSSEVEMTPLFAQKGVRLAVRVPVTPLFVTGDISGIKRVLSSLLENALAYTPTGGQVEISAEDRDGEALIEVRDNGCGIPAEALPRIFDRFYRVDPSRNRQSGGYGLGLAIAQQIAVAHGCEIAVESSPGEGTCFRFSMRRSALR